MGSSALDHDRVYLGEAAARVFAGAGGAIGVLTLLGYALHAPLLVNLMPNMQAMSVTTALLCFGLSASVFADLRKSATATRLIGLGVLATSVSVLVSQGWAGRDVVSPTLVKSLLGSASSAGTSVATAVCSGFLAVGCLTRPRGQPAAALAVVVMVTSGIAILGYAYGVRDLYSLSPFRTMSLRTACALFAVALAMLLANRQVGVSALVAGLGVTGRATRRQLSFLIIPPLAGFILLRATSAEQLGPGAAMALLVVLTVAPLAGLILRDARSATALENATQSRARADQAKLAAETRYRTLFSQLESGFCVIEVAFDATGRPTDYRFLEVNPAFAAQTGLADAEGRWMRELSPDHDQHWFDIYGRVALNGEPLRFEQNAAALGRYFDVYAFRIDAPEDHHVALLFNDLSERRRAELDLQALNETLEKRVAARTAALEQAQEALRQSQKLEAIGQLTGGVAHDFNNLLTVIRGSVELLKRPELSAERSRRYLDAIGDTADRAAKLTGQLLAFARRQALRPELFDAGTALKDVSDIVTTLVGSRIELEVRQPIQPCHILADRTQFDTAIINMAVNARDAMNGEGRIVLATWPVSGVPAVRSHQPLLGDFVAVTIGDTGMGIAADDFGRIFEPFFTTKEVGAGTGLGLSQVFGFAKQSGGDVRVDSIPGEGATFTLYLPRAYPESALPEPDTTLEPASGDGVCVLVVEDNNQVGEFAIQALAELGYESVLACNAQAALERLGHKDSHFDIVFSDVVMPGMSGLELGEEVRRRHPDLPVILTSGYSHVLAQNGEYGFELLHKPYSVEQLSRVLTKALGWTRRRRKYLKSEN